MLMKPLVAIGLIPLHLVPPVHTQHRTAYRPNSACTGVQVLGWSVGAPRNDSCDRSEHEKCTLKVAVAAHAYRYRCNPTIEEGAPDAVYQQRLRTELCAVKPWQFCDPEIYR